MFLACFLAYKALCSHIVCSYKKNVLIVNQKKKFLSCFLYFHLETNEKSLQNVRLELDFYTRFFMKILNKNTFKYFFIIKNVLIIIISFLTNQIVSTFSTL